MSFSSSHRQSILFLAANPKDTTRLRLDQELRDIGEGLRRAQKRDEFQLEQRLAVRPRDIQRAMLDVNPQIIHFSGHGTGDEGLVFEDEIGNAKLVEGEALAGLFKLFADQIRCVLLNGCYSEVQAKAIAQHVNYVIGMSQAIGDQAAVEFAVGFYDALGAGRPIEFAYELGCAAMRMAGIAEHLTPVLLKKSRSEDVTVQPTSYALLQPTPQVPEYMPSVKRLQTKYEDLEEEYEEVRKKLRWLKKEQNIKTDSEAKYELEQRIEEYEERIQEIEQELEDLEKQINLSKQADVLLQPPSQALVEQSQNAPIDVFISYSHKDDDLREELVTHLANLRRQGKITAWHDRAIEAGEEWEAQIKGRLESARVILLLISPPFVASDYCYDIEMQQAIKRHNAGTARVIPIILRPCDWKDSPFSKLQVLPKDAKPVTQWSDRDAAFLDVVEGIRKAIDSLRNGSKK